MTVLVRYAKNWITSGASTWASSLPRSQPQDRETIEAVATRSRGPLTALLVATGHSGRHLVPTVRKQERRGTCLSNGYRLESVVAVFRRGGCVSRERGEERS
jgi:hypothetical protein